MAIAKHHVKSKLAVAYVMENTPHLKEFHPETNLLMRNSLLQMARKYDKVYLKPDGGHKSEGILRIDKRENRYTLRQAGRVHQIQVTTLPRLWAEVRKITRGKRYVIQKGIESVTRDNRHFDLRCHALRVKGEWAVGGICARLGSLGNIVTTSHQGGTPTLLQTLWTKHLHYSDEKIKEMQERLQNCILKTVEAISPMYPHHKEFAVDIGIDPDQRIWIFEVNIEPLIRGNFKMLPDQTLYQRICALRKKAK